MKKFISIFTIFTICIGVLFSSITVGNADSKSKLPPLKSKYIVLMDYNSGNILYQKNANQRLYPASTTKIWTAFCVLKKCKNLNEVITIKKTPNIDGSSMYLQAGEKFTVYQLLESLLIHSSNDVGYILALHFGNGKVSNFVKFMNQEAVKYGATNTHFNNPHGLPDKNHYSTAMDMTNLARVAYGNSVIRKIVAMKEVSFPKSKDCKLARHLYNSNKFLTGGYNIDYNGKSVPVKYSIVDGIKTGYTDDAGNCLISTAKKNGIRLICGVFKAPGGNLYQNSRTLLDYGFNNFKNIIILKKKDFSGSKKVSFAIPGHIKYSLASDYVLTLPIDSKLNKKDFTTKYNFNNLKLPIKKGDIIGTLNVFDKGNMVSCIGLVAESGSQDWISYVKEHIPFIGGSKDKNSSTKNASSNVKNTPTNDKTSKGNESFIDKTKSFLVGIWSSIKGFFGGCTDFFKTYMNTSFFTNVQKSDFYKYLDTTISSYQKVVPSKYIIFGVPILILLVILILIIEIIKDGIIRRREKKKEKKEMKVSDIVTKNSKK